MQRTLVVVGQREQFFLERESLQAICLAYLAFCAIAVYSMVQSFFCNGYQHFYWFYGNCCGIVGQGNFAIYGTQRKCAYADRAVLFVKQGIGVFEGCDTFGFLERKHIVSGSFVLPKRGWLFCRTGKTGCYFFCASKKSLIALAIDCPFPCTALMSTRNPSSSSFFAVLSPKQAKTVLPCW